jgi:hypothetical protein
MSDMICWALSTGLRCMAVTGPMNAPFTDFYINPPPAYERHQEMNNSSNVWARYHVLPPKEKAEVTRTYNCLRLARTQRAMEECLSVTAQHR